MWYWLLVVCLSLVGIIACLPQLQAYIRKFNTGINFFLTLIATLIGVLLAIAISDYETEKKETLTLIKLLNAADKMVSENLSYGQRLQQYYSKLEDEDPRKALFFSKNPPPYPDYLDNLLLQNLVNKKLSPEALGELNEYSFNLKKIRETDVGLYLTLLPHLSQIIQLEIQYQKGELDFSELELQIDKVKGQVAQQEMAQ